MTLCEYFAVKNTEHFICGFYVDAQIKEFNRMYYSSASQM